VTTYRLFPSTNGPATPAGYSGAFQAGVVFEVTSGGIWFDGYWWWVCNSGQQTTGYTFALWEVITGVGSTNTVAPGTAVTAGTLTAGQWNYVPLAVPVMLSVNVGYVAVCGYTSSTGFPESKDQFGSGDSYSAGITNGPLFAYSDGSGSAPPPVFQSQGLFGTGTASGGNANVNYPNSGSDSSANFWMDVQVDTVAPSGAAYQIWPSQPFPVNANNDTANNFTLGTEFTLSQACTLDEILYYSPPGVTQLATSCGIFNVLTQTLVPGTFNSSPSWSGVAGSGWVSCSYSGPVLPAGDYKTCVCNGAGSPAIWSSQTGPSYWASPGAGANGITNGPITAPNFATATSPGQSTYNAGATLTYPLTSAGAYTYWVDVQVTPQAAAVSAPPLFLAPMRVT
jgi:hypothetical protein